MAVTWFSGPTITSLLIACIHACRPPVYTLYLVEDVGMERHNCNTIIYIGILREKVQDDLYRLHIIYIYIYHHCQQFITISTVKFTVDMIMISN